MISIRKTLGCIALAMATMAATSAYSATFSQMVVFGDSLSDNGNITLLGYSDPTQVVTGNGYVPSATYASGVFSNGPVWATTFAGMLGLTPFNPSVAAAGGAPGATDFAFGGARTSGGSVPSLLAQTGMYFSATGGTADPNALYVVAGGGNNARDALTDPSLVSDPFGTAGAYAATFASDIGTIVDQLQDGGAQHIVVWNAPNLGMAPAVTLGGVQAIGAANLVAGSMNAALSARLAGESGVQIFDLYGLLSNPNIFAAFTNTTDACGAAAAGTDCSKYIFWDGIHPTTAAHSVIAQQMALAVPEPQTYALMALGLVAVGFVARRRKTLH